MAGRAAARAQHQEDVDLVLAEYNETYLNCRDLMHSWRTVGFFRSAGWGSSTSRSLLCDRCGMERTDIWDGVTVRHNYRQPEGYRVEGRTISKGEVREEQMRRSHIYDSEEAMRKALKPSMRRRLHSV